MKKRARPARSTHVALAFQEVLHYGYILIITVYHIFRSTSNRLGSQSTPAIALASPADGCSPALGGADARPAALTGGRPHPHRADCAPAPDRRRRPPDRPAGLRAARPDGGGDRDGGGAGGQDLGGFPKPPRSEPGRLVALPHQRRGQVWKPALPLDSRVRGNDGQGSGNDGQCAARGSAPAAGMETCPTARRYGSRFGQ